MGALFHVGPVLATARSPWAFVAKPTYVTCAIPLDTYSDNDFVRMTSYQCAIRMDRSVGVITLEDPASRPGRLDYAMTVDISRLFSNADQFVCGLDARQDQLRWTQANAPELASAAFLDQRFLKNKVVHSVKLGEALAYHRSHPHAAQRASYIFHTSFSCSTLLAKCIDRSQAALALKEPSLLFDLAQYKRQNPEARSTAQLQNLLSLADRLLAQAGGGRPVVIKPTNTANNLIEPLLNDGNPPRMLLLHGELREFLISVAKYGTRSRLFARQLFQSLRHDVDVVGRTTPEAAMMMTDLQVAAASWFGQIRLFHQVSQTHCAALATLSTPTFLNNRVRALGAVCHHFQLPLSRPELESLAQSGVLERDAKFDHRLFNADRRQAETEEVEKRHGSEIDETVAWLEGVMPSQPLVRHLETLSVLAPGARAGSGRRSPAVPPAAAASRETLRG